VNRVGYQLKHNLFLSTVGLHFTAVEARETMRKTVLTKAVRTGHANVTRLLIKSAL